MVEAVITNRKITINFQFFNHFLSNTKGTVSFGCAFFEFKDFKQIRDKMRGERKWIILDVEIIIPECLSLHF